MNVFSQPADPMLRCRTKTKSEITFLCGQNGKKKNLKGGLILLHSTEKKYWLSYHNISAVFGHWRQLQSLYRMKAAKQCHVNHPLYYIAVLPYRINFLWEVEPPFNSSPRTISNQRKWRRIWIPDLSAGFIVTWIRLYLNGGSWGSRRLSFGKIQWNTIPYQFHPLFSLICNDSFICMSRRDHWFTFIFSAY